MKLKQNVVMILILAGLLGSICLGIAVTRDSNSEIKVPEDIPQEEVVPATFNKGIMNSKEVPTEVMDVITNYMDDYFLSIYLMELQDTTKYFSNGKEAKVSDYSIKFTIESRKLYDFDFTMSDAGYTLNITDYYKDSNGKHHVDFLEDDYMNFKFLNGISSESYDIENSIVIEEVNGEYKIANYDKTQGYYMMFRNDIDENLDDVYKMYFDELQYAVMKENKYKTEAKTTPYVSDKKYSKKYDRDAAAKYAQTYYHSRNDNWYDFSEEGNCQNFASQMLIAGGMTMDYDGYEDENEIWYYNDNADYTSTWTGVPYFHKYCKSDDPTLVCDVDINTYYAEPGDIIQVGLATVTHSTVVSRIVDGHILLNSNSIDMKDYPLEAYAYPVRKLIKILGSN